jgi:energy-coupling factor transport system ATP-binding protein
VVALLAVVGTFAVSGAIWLAVVWVAVIALALSARIGKAYGWFLVSIIFPLSAALLIVWGIVVAAPPGAPLGSDQHAGFQYAATIALRLAILGGIFQLTILTIPPDELPETLRKGGLRGGLLLIVLGAFALLPELKQRADQVLTARQARGLVTDRSLRSRIQQFPYLLRPLFAWALRSSIQRSEFWHQRHLLARIDGLDTERQESNMTDALASTESERSGIYDFVGLRASPLVALIGPNFSGRTRVLRRFTGLSDADTVESVGPTYAARPRAYVGPEIYNVLSGLTQTVLGELRLFSGGSFKENRFVDAAHRLGLDHLYHRNPFTLSGGEQTCLAVLSALALRPQRLGLDSALEQLDGELRTAVLRLLADESQTATLVTHNRPSELGSVGALDIGNVPGSTSFTTPSQFGCIKPDETATRPQKPLSIHLRAVRFRYSRATEVVKGLSLDLLPGQLYYLCGSNGAGKSTVAKILTGVLKPSHGQMMLGDASFEPWRHPGRIVAYHFQNPDLQLFSTSVEEEVYAGPKAARYSDTECSRLAEAMIRTFGLENVRAEHPLDLPFVMRKRVALAASLAVGTPWIVLDEPTLGQDENSSHAIASVIAASLDAGIGVIVITHSVSFRDLIAGHVLLLRDGALASADAHTELGTGSEAAVAS